MIIEKLFSKEFWTAERLAESIAVLSSFLYTFLYIKGSPWCWFFAFLGSAIFTYLCYFKRILAESFLQLFYVVMAIYGYLNMQSHWQMASWDWPTHMVLIALGIICMLISSFLLKKYTDAKMPLEDSFTTVFGILATWLMVNFIHENYLYWMVIDAVSVHLYWKRGLYFASMLFVVYTFMVTAGYFGWM